MPSNSPQRPRPHGPVLDHIGIAVADIAEALRFYRDALGLEVELRKKSPPSGCAHFVACGAALELLEATADDSRSRNTWRSGAPGFTTSRAGTIAVALERLKARASGSLTTCHGPARTARWRVRSPSSTHGVSSSSKR